MRRIAPDGAGDFASMILESPYKKYQYIRAISPDAQTQYHLARLQSGCQNGNRLSLGVFNGSEPLAVLLSEFLDWDSEVLGIPCARILEVFHNPALSFEQAVAVLSTGVRATLSHWQSEKNIQFADARTDARYLPYIVSLERSGFGFMEASLVYAYNAKETPLPESAPSVVTRTGTANDLPIIDRIARALFTNDRFHRDPRFPPGAADRLYQKWLENTISGKRGRIVVLEFEGRVAAFHTGYLDDEFNLFSETKIGIFDLIAVIPNPRLLKAWEAVISGISRAGLRYGATIGEGRTQAHNVGTMFRLLRLPPSYTRSEVTFHWWKNTSG
ncbi:MAG: hypothetical protein V2G42_04520 [bacterium JZ-2024 1]